MTAPNTVDTSTDCPECGRTISERAAVLVDDAGCLFCREDDGE